MRPNPGLGVLGVVLGGAVGALIGLALIKLVSPWCIPIGAVLGTLIGIAIVRGGKTSRPGYSNLDGEDVVDNVATGCLVASCLADGLSCLGVLALLFAGLAAGILMILR